MHLYCMFLYVCYSHVVCAIWTHEVPVGGASYIEMLDIVDLTFSALDLSNVLYNSKINNYEL